MKQMTPSEYYQLTPINSGTDKNITESDTLLRTLIEYLLSATGWYTKIPKLTLATGFEMNWVSHDKLSEAGIETKIYVDHSDEPTGNWTTYIYSIWYKGAACALVHANGKYSDQINIYVTNIQNFKQVIDEYIGLAINLTNLYNCVDDYIVEPDAVIDSTLFARNNLEKYYDPNPNMPHKVGDKVNVKTYPGNNSYASKDKYITVEVEIIKINPHQKLNRYYGKITDTIKYEYDKTVGYRIWIKFNDADIVVD